jgi:dihydropteroate synthase
VAAAVLAAERGADLLRVHDVAETVDAVKLIHALRDARSAAAHRGE